ncbi:MAG: methylmalonyl-CoA mutase family protein, partial [Planctomycetota bacterium]
MAEPTTFSLAGDFPKLDKAEWQALAEAALKGAPVAKLVKRVGDLTIDPLYLAESDLVDVGWPGAAPFVRGTAAHRAPWDIKQVYRFARPTAANRAILTDLERGVTSVELHLDGACRTGGDERSTDLVGDGLALANIESLQTTLAGVFDELAPVGFSAGAAGGPAAAVLLGLAQSRGHDQKAYKTQLNLDPVGAWGAGDSPELSVHDGLAIAADVAGYLRAWPSVRATRVDGRIYHDAGADEVDELASMLATSVAYLQAMTEAGLSVEEAARHVVLRTSLDADLFLNIAKLRALRQTWGRIVDAAGGRTQDIHIEATSSATMMTKRDPWVNMLRTTAACFAGAVGGAQTLHLRPFDEAVGLPNDLALRVARNTQIVLQSESHLDQVIDPAGGSWYVENITRQMAEAAWARFQ